MNLLPKRYMRFRTLQYVGTREQLDEAWIKRQVKGCIVPKSGCSIFEACNGDTPLSLEPVVFEWLHTLRDAAKTFFPDDDSRRDGYLQAIDDILDKVQT